MPERIGLDPGLVHSTLSRMSGMVDELDGIAEELRSSWLAALNPGEMILAGIFGGPAGALAVSGRSIWVAQAAAAELSAAADACRRLESTARAAIGKQQRVSGSADSAYYAAGISAADRRRRIEEVVADPGLLLGMTPLQRAALFASTNPMQRDALVAAAPRTIGNLDGAPVAMRVEANRIVAAMRLEGIGLSSQEGRYLAQVVAGDRNLFAYDPDQGGVIELVGRVGPNTTDVITYLPGTGTTMGGFFDGSIQETSEALVEADRSNGTVAFVYMNEPWATWAGESANTNGEYLAGLGERVAAFQRDAVGTIGLPAGVGFTVIAHSAGETVAAFAEVGGAHFDHHLALAGSWLPPGFLPQSGTEYHAFQYGIDAINALNLVDGLPTPTNSGVFEVHLYDPGWAALSPLNPLDNHGRIADGDRNREALDDIYRMLHQ